MDTDALTAADDPEYGALVQGKVGGVLWKHAGLQSPDTGGFGGGDVLRRS